ncbi:hypothetical protein H2248_004587 [Termitomyces sp. 'cryptogamus']|nr:hypothetical protein H2248_004587 [Termitomyces sp. 'cryptogamus']
MSSSDAFSGPGADPSPGQNIFAQFSKIQRQYQQTLDRWTPHVFQRWLSTGGLLTIFFLRILLAQVVHRLVSFRPEPFAPFLNFLQCAVCQAFLERRVHCSFSLPSTDAHAIYLLNLLLAFLQPKFDPSLQDDLMADEIEEGGEDATSPLPSQRDDEFRPFVRRLPEWQFWLSSTRATIIALFCTFSEIFDVPVYWPILVIYFFVLFALTMRRQIQHMIKYKYIPFDIGRKARYGTK